MRFDKCSLGNELVGGYAECHLHAQAVWGAVYEDCGAKDHGVLNSSHYCRVHKLLSCRLTILAERVVVGN